MDGKIIGLIALSGVAFLSLVALLTWLLWRRKRHLEAEAKAGHSNPLYETMTTTELNRAICMKDLMPTPDAAKVVLSGDGAKVGKSQDMKSTDFTDSYLEELQPRRPNSLTIDDTWFSPLGFSNPYFTDNTFPKLAHQSSVELFVDRSPITPSSESFCDMRGDNKTESYDYDDDFHMVTSREVIMTSSKQIGSSSPCEEVGTPQMMNVTQSSASSLQPINEEMEDSYVTSAVTDLSQSFGDDDFVTAQSHDENETRGDVSPDSFITLEVPNKDAEDDRPKSSKTTILPTFMLTGFSAYQTLKNDDSGKADLESRSKKEKESSSKGFDNPIFVVVEEEKGVGREMSSLTPGNASSSASAPHSGASVESDISIINMDKEGYETIVID